jgi:hypothetical protein
MGVTCHRNLLCLDPAEGGQLRRKAHEDYFGSQDPDVVLPQWFEPTFYSAYQYLDHRIFDNPMRGEHLLGVQFSYEEVRRYELDELFHQHDLDGDFCVVHVKRNPVACLVSRKQAEQSGVWFRGYNERNGHLDITRHQVRLLPEELTTFVRQALAMEERLKRISQDYLCLEYSKLYADPKRMLYELMEFLESPDATLPIPAYRKIWYVPMPRRVSNWYSLKLEVPRDVRESMEEVEKDALSC